MASIGNLVLKMSLNATAIQSGLASLQQRLDGFGNSVANAATGFAALLGVGSVAGGLGLGIKMAAEAEQMQTAFTVMLGSAESAKQVLGDIRKFAADTPFEQPELIAAGRQLIAFGVAGERVVGTLRMLGDISSGVGMPIGELAYLFGTLKSQGRAFTVDVQQFATRGIPIWEELGKIFGKTTSEMRPLVEAGKVGFADVLEAMENMTMEGGRFFDMTGQMAGTLMGLWSTLKDGVGAVLQELGEAIVKHFDLKAATKGLIGLVEVVKSQFVPLVIGTIEWIVKWRKVIGTVIAAVTAATVAIRLWTMAKAVSLALSGPSGWATLAIGLGVAYAATQTLSSAWDSLEASIKKAGAAAEKTKGTLGEQFIERRNNRIQDMYEELDKVEKKAEKLGIEDQGRGFTLQAVPKKWGNDFVKQNAEELKHQEELVEAIRNRWAIAEGAIAKYNEKLADQKRILELNKGVETGADKFKKQIQELLDLEERGQPMGRLFGEEGLKALEDLENSLPKGAAAGPNALLEGSSAAMSAIIKAQRQPRETVEDRIRRALELANEMAKQRLAQGAAVRAAVEKIAEEGLINQQPI